jgi:hypothetical protein
MNVFENAGDSPNYDDEDNLSLVGLDSSPHNELQSIVDHLERPVYDEDPYNYNDDWIDDDTIDGRVDWSREDDE